MQKIYAILGLSALLVGLSALNSAQVSAQEAKQRLDILGFSADAQQMLVKIDDVNTGLNLRLYDVETGALKKKIGADPVPARRGHQGHQRSEKEV